VRNELFVEDFLDLGLRHLFLRWARSSGGEHQTDYQGLVETPPTLEGEYQRLVHELLARCGVPDGVVAIEVRQQEARRKKPTLVAELTLQRWERDAALRVLVGLPLLERKIRKALPALWVADVSTFEGLTLKVSPALLEARPLTELRQVLSSVTRPSDKKEEAL
jgi:hypothetical protein